MKFLIRLLQFALLSVGVYVLLVFVLSRLEVYDRPLIYRATNGLVMKGGDAYRTYSEYAIDKEEYDVLIVGSSHAYRGYDPAIFEEQGYQTFNLGSNSQSPCQSLVVIQDIARLDNKPTILLDIYPQVLFVDDFESSSTLVTNISEESAATRIAWGLKDIRSINMWTLRLVNRSREPILGDEDYAYKGYAQKADSASAEIVYEGRDRVFEANSKQTACLEEILQFCNDNQLPIVLVSHPRPLEIGSKNHHTFIEFFDELAKTYEFDLLDYSFDHALNSTDHFYDHTHLNTAGVDLFNHRLTKDLERIGVKKNKKQ